MKLVVCQRPTIDRSRPPFDNLDVTNSSTLRMNRQTIPDDFPRASQQGTVPRIRPMLHFTNFRTCSELLSDDELRYMQCEDIAVGVDVVATRRIMRRQWSSQMALSNIEASVIEAVRWGGWEFTNAEVAWTIDRARQLVSESGVHRENKPTEFVLDQPTPTLFLDYDGTLHRGHGLLDEHGNVSLDSGQPMFEYAPLLVSMLEPFPDVQIVLTTSWLERLPLEQVLSYLPPALAKRVVATTKGIKPRFGYLKDGSARTYVIRCYVFENHLKNWLALDDSVYGAFHLSTEILDLSKHLVLLNSKKGIGDSAAQKRIEEWLFDAHRFQP
jgi:hypothetical protein